jgi:hypothetical protein
MANNTSAFKEKKNEEEYVIQVLVIFITHFSVCSSAKKGVLLI